MKTLKVKMLVPMGGPDVDRPIGSIHEIEAEEAKRLVEREFAEVVQPKRTPRETATRSGRETAEHPAAKTAKK